MSIFFTSDCHLSHDAIRRYCNRPFASMEEMNEKIVSNWNSIVSPKDQVYILGDFAWRNHNHWIQLLKGKKILVKGNHDKMNQETLRNFTEVSQILQKTFDGNHQIIMCHFPLISWNARTHGTWHLYGHCHGRISERKGRLAFDVGMDVWNFQVIPYDVIVKKMNDLSELTEAEIKDHLETSETFQMNLTTNLNYLKSV